MNKVEKKAADATVTTGKLKDVTNDPKVLKAFGGVKDDTVVSIKLPGKAHEAFKASVAKEAQGPILGQSDVAEMFKKNLFTLEQEEQKHAVVDPWGSQELLVGRRATDLPQGDDLTPTDRQIRNAERVLRAAGLDSDTLVTEAVAQALEKVQATGTFINEGVLQEPIETGLVVDYNRISSTLLDKAFYLPHPVGQAYQDKLFSLYKLTIREREVYYLLDSNSTVSLGGGDARPGFNIRQPYVPSHGVLCLINSSSNDDVVIGESTLVNTESAYNVLNNSVLARTKEPNYEYGPGLDYIMDIPVVRKHEVKERMNIRECQFKRASVFDSRLTKGVYRDSQIRDTRIDGSGYVTVGTSQLSDANIRGTRVTIKGVHLSKSGVISEGELLLKYCRFSGVHISAKAVYIPNKFSYLELDTPQHKLYLIRSTRRDFDLGVNLHNLERFRLDATEEDIQKHVAIQLALDPEGFHTRPTLISCSIASYMTDSIVSRLKVIRLLDEAKQLVRETGDHSRPWDDIYSV